MYIHERNYFHSYKSYSPDNAFIVTNIYLETDEFESPCGANCTCNILSPDLDSNLPQSMPSILPNLIKISSVV